ncbi:MAG: SH3 domain-containing protein, partial [Anaerolineales bacterium]|nr:SH3 domain-containing protein [Anaerolineales bacterium]
ISTEEPMADTQITPAYTPPPPNDPPANKRSSKLPLIIAAVLVVVLLIILGFWIWNSSRSATSSEGDIPVETVPVVVPEGTQPPLPTETTSALQPVTTDTPTPVPTAQLIATAVIPTATPETVLPSTEITIGSIVRVFGTGTDGLAIRDNPGITNLPVGVAPESTIMEVIGGPLEADSFQWWQVRLESGIEGWAAADFLEPVPEP